VCFADRPPAEHRPGAACERCGLERCRHRIAPFRGGVEEEP
jgi:hypothetical protein